MYIYIRISIRKLHFLPGEIFLCSSNLSSLMRQLLAAVTLTVKVIALQKQQPDAVHCYTEKWMLWFGAHLFIGRLHSMMEDTFERRTFLIIKCSDKGDQLIFVYYE